VLASSAFLQASSVTDRSQTFGVPSGKQGPAAIRSQIFPFLFKTLFLRVLNHLQFGSGPNTAKFLWAALCLCFTEFASGSVRRLYAKTIARRERPLSSIGLPAISQEIELWESSSSCRQMFSRRRRG
jgi:hypothetical protein